MAIHPTLRSPSTPAGDETLADSWSRRFNLMMRHTWLMTLAGVLLLAGLGALWYYIASLPTHLKIAVGPAASEDTRVVEEIAQHLKDDRPSMRGIRLHIVRVSGTPEAARAIDSGEADLAIVRRDIGMPKEGQAVAILRKNVVALWVLPPEPKPKEEVPASTKKSTKKPPAKAAEDKPAKNDKKSAAKKDKKKGAKDDEDEKPARIEKVEELLGKRVGIIGRSQVNIALFKVIAGQYGIAADKIVMLGPEDENKPNAPDRISIVQIPTDKVAQTIRESKFDAILSVGPVSSYITAAGIGASRRDKETPTFIDITAAEAIAERHPVYETAEIKAGAFGGAPKMPAEDVETIGVNHYIVARKKLSEDTVADFTRHLFAIRATISNRLPAAAKIEKPDTDKDATVPVHPGAAAYIDGELKTFFDRYNDVLYWAVMLLSFFGSAIAGLVTYNKADDRVRKLQSLERLLELTKSSRAAETLAQLDDVQAETDQLMTDMVKEVENDKLDEAALMAFSIALDQAQIAISDRRASLLGLPPRTRTAVASL